MDCNITNLEKLQYPGKTIGVIVNDIEFTKLFSLIKVNTFKGVSSRSIYYWKKQERPIPINYFLQICSDKIINVRIDYLCLNGGSRLKIPQETTKFVYMLGLILGDGCLSFNKKWENGGSYTLQITMRAYNEAEEVSRLIREIFDLKSSIYPGRGCYNVTCFSKALVVFLNGLYSIPIGKKYKDMCVPCLIRDRLDLVPHFIKGLFDSDGNVYIKRGKRCIQLRQRSKSFIFDVLLLFNKLSIGIKGPYYDKANNSWLLWSNKKEVVKAFDDKINIIKMTDL